MSADRSNRALLLLSGIGIGAALMYFIDPDRGTRRRHVLRDKANSAARSLADDARDAVQNARNHGQGVVAEARRRLREEQVTGEQLVARIRAELGHHVERARAIEVVA